MLKKITISLLILCLSALVFLPVQAAALDLGGTLVDEAAKKAGYQDKAADKTTFAETIGTVIQIALSFVGVIFLVLMVYAGFKWMTARGEEEQVKTAQKIITASIIGLIIVIAAYSITYFVVPRLLQAGKVAGEVEKNK